MRHLHRPIEDQDERSGLTPAKVELIWGVSAKACGFGSSGLSAALWATDRDSAVERRRPSCPNTHVVSVWTFGSTVSELYLDGKLRFRRIRRRGTFQLTRASEDLRVVLSETSGTCLDLYIPTAYLRSAVEEGLDRSSQSFELLPLKLEADPIVTRVADEVAAEIQRPGLATRMALDGSMQQLCVGLVRRWSNLSGELRPHRTGLTDDQVRRTVEHLNDALHIDLSLEDLAKRIGLSTFHFARAFKISVGIPPHRYQLQLRLAKARELLEQTKLPIEEVAGRVGYEDASFFSRAFRREFGISPGAYRRTRA